MIIETKKELKAKRDSLPAGARDSAYKTSTVSARRIPPRAVFTDFPDRLPALPGCLLCRSLVLYFLLLPGLPFIYLPLFFLSNFFPTSLQLLIFHRFLTNEMHQCIKTHGLHYISYRYSNNICLLK